MLDESELGPPNFNPLEGVLLESKGVPLIWNPLEVVLVKVLLELSLPEDMGEPNVPT